MQEHRAIASEAAARGNADTSLTTRLGDEEDARASAVVSHSTSASAVLETASNSLTTRLGDEETARTSADSSLTTRLADVSTSVSVVLFNADANYDTLAEIANAFEQADTGVLDTITSLGVKLDALSTTLSTLTE